jgi:hypothetical protein
MSASLDEYDRRISACDEGPMNDAGASELIQLKCQRNALVPICSAPVEILARVLLLLRRPRKRFGGPIAVLRLDEPWAYAMLVCHRFRAVALATTALWSTVSLASPKGWVALCLERARDHPLDLLAVDARTCALLPRARLAHVYAEAPVALTMPAPHLEVLELRAQQRTHVGSPFLGGTLAALTRLTLTAVTLPPDMPAMPRLRRVELIRSTVDLRAFLECAPSVQDVFVEDVSVPAPASSPAEVSPVALPHLRILHVKDRTDRVLRYLPLFPRPSGALGLALMWPEEEVDKYQYEALYRRWAAAVSGAAERTAVFSGWSLELLFNAPVDRPRFRAKSASFLSLTLNPSTRLERGLLAHADTMHVFPTDDNGDDVDTGQFAIGACLDAMSNAYELVLEGFGAECEPLGELEQWLAANPGRMRTMELVECNRGMQLFVKRVKRMGLTVEWDLLDGDEGSETDNDDEQS